MGVDAMRIGVQMRKVVFFWTRACYRSVCNHPFLLGFVCFLMFLYRSFPFVFLFLVSASPVLVCTAILLGTLLSFGQTNIPEIEMEEKVATHDIASLRTGVVEDTTVVKGDKNESFATVERYVGMGRNIKENDLDEPILVESRGIEVQDDDGLVDCMPFVDMNCREIQFEKQLVEIVERESDDLLELEKHREICVEKPGIEGKLIDGEFLDNLDSKDGINSLVVEDDKSPGGLIDVLKEDQLGYVPGLSLSDAFRQDQLGSSSGSSFIDALKEDQLGCTPGSYLIDALKEDHFASASGSSLIKEDQLGFAPGFSWRRIEEDYGEVDEADGDESLDSGSDGTEISSPDASMADIMPMLDELHPLLELEAPQPARTSHDGSDAGSERLHESEGGSVDSEEDTDNQGDEGEGEDDNDGDEAEEGEGEDDNDDDEEEGEKVKGEKEDESKSAIKWTEFDQKNLMDLGMLELERNQRLESLIARRRAHKNMRLMAEKNLIDLESSDLPFIIPPIATSRQNPFELPDHTVIPGSAPSVLLPRRNPFDLPYDPNEEKPDLKSDSFQQEFSGFQHKEPVYRRNETFSIGPSVFGGSRHERQDFKWRPYFVPERFSPEDGTGYPSFQRQLSEVSESKLSSVPDSESVNSAVDEEDRKSLEQVPEQFASEGMSYATLHRQISEISESKTSSVPDTESVSSVVDKEDKKLNKEDVCQEIELISNLDHGANHVDCGSKSSGEVDYVDIEQDETRGIRHDEVITLGDVGNHHENEPSSSGTDGTSSPQELKANESHLKTEPVEEYSSRSSYSSFTEVDENTPDARNEGGSTNFEKKKNFFEELGVSTHTLPEESEFQFMSEVVEHREPVYDSSPPGMERFLSFTTISSDTQLEISEMTSLPVLLESAEKDSEEHSEDSENDSSEFEETCASPSLNVVILPNSSDKQLAEEGMADKDRHMQHDADQAHSSNFDADNRDDDFQDVGQEQDPPSLTEQVPMVHSLSYSGGDLVQELSSDNKETRQLEEVQSSSLEFEETCASPSQNDVSLSSLSDKQLVEEGMAEKGRHMQHDADQALSSNFEADNRDDDFQDVRQEQDPPSLTEQVPMVHSLFYSRGHLVQELSSDNKENCQLEEVQSSSLEFDETCASPSQNDVSLSSSSDKQLVEEGMANKDRQMQHDADQAHSSNFDADNRDDDFQDVGQEQDPPYVTEQVQMVHSLSSSGGDLVLELSSDNKKTRQLEEVQSSSLEFEETCASPSQSDVSLSSSLDKQLVGEGVADKDRHMQHDADQAHSSNFDADNCDDHFQDVGKEQDPPYVTEQVPMVHSLSSLEGDLVQELSSDNKETRQLEEVQSSSLEKNNSGLHQDTDGKVVSANFGYEDVPFEEKSSSELEKQLSWLYKPPSSDDPDESQEVSSIPIESIDEESVANNESASEDHNHAVKTLKNSSPLTSGSPSTPLSSPLSRSPGGDEVNMINNGNAFEIHDDEHKTQRNSSSLTSDSSSITPFQSHKDQSPCGEDVKENILDRVVYGDPGYVKEHFYNTVEAYDPHVNEENINEANEIKEIDEGLLSELDTVGDFSVKEVVGEPPHIELMPAETNIYSTESLLNDSVPLETNQELPVFEVKSIQDIVLAFKQLDEGVDLDEVILPSMFKNQVVSEDDNFDNLPVVGAQSVEDIHAVLKQVSESNLAEPPKPLESNDHSTEVEKRDVVSTEQIESSSDLHSVVPEDSATALRLTCDKENIINGDQVPAPIQTEALVIPTENENPKGT